MTEQAVDPVVYELIIRVVTERTGLKQMPDIDSRLPQVVTARMAALNISSPAMYHALLAGASSGQELRRFTALLTVGETHFFRDRAQISLLRNVILPRLLENAGPRRSLRILSAGCSTGEEPYSIAMLADEILCGRAGWDIFILGVDINEEAIEKAKAGVYSDWSFRGTDPALRDRYFHKRADGWELDERVRKMVAFRVINLVEDEYPSSASGIHDIDLALCRNVFIYFQRSSVELVFRKLAMSLSDGGYLVTGHAETLGVPAPGLAVRMFPESVMYQRVTGQAEGHYKNLSLPQPSPAKRDGGKKSPPAQGKIESVRPGLEDEILSLIRNGSFEEAVSKAGGLDEAGGKCFASVLLKAWARANSGEYEKAMDGLNEAVRINQLEPIIYYLMSQIHQLEGEFEKAKTTLKKTLYLDHAFIPAHLELASLYERDNNPGRARKSRLAALDVLATMPPDRRLGWYNIHVPEIMESVKNLL